MIVVDASVLALALLDEDRIGDAARDALTTDNRLVMPERWAVEVLSVAAAEKYECPLVTADAKLTRASGIRCRVSLVE